jgi:hypothetical protein
MASDEMAVPVLIHRHHGAVSAYINHGRWVADCGYEHCRNALQLEYGDPGFLCLGSGGCGRAFDVVWPSPEMARTIVGILVHRPAVYTRNWLPGETLTELMIENITHGVEHCSTPEVGAASSRLVIESTEDTAMRIVIHDSPIVIDAAERPEIEG